MRNRYIKCIKSMKINRTRKEIIFIFTKYSSNSNFHRNKNEKSTETETIQIPQSLSIACSVDSWRMHATFKASAILEKRRHAASRRRTQENASGSFAAARIYSRPPSYRWYINWIVNARHAEAAGPHKRLALCVRLFARVLYTHAYA